MTRGRGSAPARAARNGGRALARRRALAPVTRDAGRRRMSGAVLTVAVTLLVAIGSYSVSARVSAERQAMERLARSNAALARQVHTLGQELRVRMRLPQLQSWNDSTLRMQPATARQLLGGSAELAIYALDRPAPPGPVLVAAEARPAPLLPVLPRPRPLPEPGLAPPAEPVPGPVHDAAPGLVLASIGAFIDAELAATPEEGSGLPPGDAPAASAVPQPVER